MAFKDILFEKSEQIATLTFNRPEKRSALNARLLEELDDSLDKAEELQLKVVYIKIIPPY